jgi:hypothetical protein
MRHDVIYREEVGHVTADDYRDYLGWRGKRVFAALGLRRPLAQHTRAEGAALRKYAAGAREVVELGVAEGGSAWELRRAMNPDGRLTLVDPYRGRGLLGVDMAELTARRAVRRVRRGRVLWVRDFSQSVGQRWQAPIDFLFIDGDHSLDGVMADWRAWTPHVVAAGVVALHDAAETSWTLGEIGPVRLVDEVLARRAWQTLDVVDSTVFLTRAFASD